MKLFKEVIKNNLKMIIFYILIGITINFLELYGITYYQKILDSFQFKTLTITPLIIYGILLVISTILGYIENYPEQQLKNKLYLDFKLQSLKKMTTIDYLEYQKIGTGKLSSKVEAGATASRDVIIDFWLNLCRSLLPTALFSLIFIYQVKKEYVLFVILGYVLVIIISNLILNKLYKLKEKILLNQEIFNKHLIRGFMELVVFRTNKKYDSEIEITKEGIKNIVDAKTKIKLVHEIFFSAFALIVHVLQVLVLAYAVFKSDLSVGAVVTVIVLLGKAYEPIAIFNVEYVDYKLNKVTVKKYTDLLDLKDDVALNKGTVIAHTLGTIDDSIDAVQKVVFRATCPAAGAVVGIAKSMKYIKEVKNLKLADTELLQRLAITGKEAEAQIAKLNFNSCLDGVMFREQCDNILIEEIVHVEQTI